MPPLKKKENKKTAKKRVAKRKTAKKQVAKRKTALLKEPKVEPIAVVLFFAHWCGHCQSMYPEWEQLKKEYESDNNFVLREVEHGNIESDKQMLEKELGVSPIQVQGFPTLVKIHPDKHIEYYENGERNKENFINWLNEAKKQPEVSSNIFQQMHYGGYKIPITGKVKTYSKNKSATKSRKSKPSLFK
jgi:thiol-disulfide isomerase/thioredoxin|uniref:Thioredoxin domain-containing protein n=1 Tax=viral metagenome TaxID=1070528 RepID=A0A6C0ISS2_9ZZZZ